MNTACLLISPPAESNLFPRGVAEIATFLIQNHIRAMVLPLGHYLLMEPVGGAENTGGELNPTGLEAILAQAIGEINPDVIGVSNIYTRDATLCARIVEVCKQLQPGALTVMGGHHATFCDAEALKSSALDVVVRGEGEWVMLNLIRALAGRTDYRKVRGISFRSNANIIRNPDQPAGRLDEIGPVDFALFPEDFVKSASIHGILTRGCAYRCTYCVEKIYWGKPRRYPLTKQISEMKVLQHSYGTQLEGMEESMLDMRSKEFDAFCRDLRSRRIELPEQFYITTRVDAVTQDGLRRLNSTGIGVVCIGVESFSPRVLKMMNKNQSTKTIRRGCELLEKHGIWTNAYWLIGHPGDSPVEAQRSFAQFRAFFEKGLLKSGHAFVFVPYPGTRYFTNPSEYGIIIGNHDWSKWRRWTDSPASWLEDFSAAQISRASQKAWKLITDYRALNTTLRQLSMQPDPIGTGQLRQTSRVRFRSKPAACSPGPGNY